MVNYLWDTYGTPNHEFSQKPNIFHNKEKTIGP